MVMNEEFDIGECKQHGVSERQVCVFAWAKEEEESNDDHVSSSLEQIRIW